MITYVDSIDGALVISDFNGEEMGYMSIEEVIKVYKDSGYNISITKEDTQPKND